MLNNKPSLAITFLPLQILLVDHQLTVKQLLVNLLRAVVIEFTEDNSFERKTKKKQHGVQQRATNRSTPAPHIIPCVVKRNIFI